MAYVARHVCKVLELRRVFMIDWPTAEDLAGVLRNWHREQGVIQYAHIVRADQVMFVGLPLPAVSSGFGFAHHVSSGQT